MPLASSQRISNSKVSQFQVTPAILSYLVCFIIGNFDSIYSYSKSGASIDVYGNLNSCKKVLNGAIEGIDFMEEYTQIKCPFSRLQLVFIPEFVNGGMENNGLITLQDYGNSKYSTFINNIYHEISHQLIGNLSTIVDKWWGSLWITEGLATFIPYLVLEKIYKKSYQTINTKINDFI